MRLATGVSSGVTCVNHTRQVAPVDPWTDFALRNQENPGIDEPLNWVSRLATHNAFNTVNYGNPGGTFGAATFGRISSAGTMRQVQLGGKLMF